MGVSPAAAGILPGDGHRLPNSPGGTPAEAARMATLPGAGPVREFPRRDAGGGGQDGHPTRALGWCANFPPAEAAMATLPGAHHCPEFPRRDGIAGQTGRFFGCVPAGVEHVFAL